MVSKDREQRTLLGIHLTPSQRVCSIIENHLVGALQRKHPVQRKIYNNLLHKKYIHLSHHSVYRLKERLKLGGLEIEKVIYDLQYGIQRIRKANDGKYTIYGEIARYITDKDKNIITVLPLKF